MRTDTQPTCFNGYRHDYFKLGVEDNGDVAQRCNTCLARRYVLPDRTVKHEAAERLQR